MRNMRTLVKLCGALCVLVCLFNSADGDTDTQWEPCEVASTRGACMPLSACVQYVALLKLPGTLEQGLRLTSERRCGFHGLEAKVCCPTKEPLVFTTEATTTEDPGSDFVDSLPKPGECGKTLLEYSLFPKPHHFPVPLPVSDYPGESPIYAYEYKPLPPPKSNNRNKVPDDISQDPTTTASPSGPLPELPPPRVAKRDADGGAQYPYDFPPPDYSNPFYFDQQPAIAGGRPVEFREMALWMALLGYRNSAVFWKCGGSIISSRHILTAAHCIQPNLYIVRVGEINLASDHQEHSPIDYLVKKMYAHEEYTKYHNDIGVVVLEESINFHDNPHIAPVCLPSSPDDQVLDKLLRSITGLITGWGETEKAGQQRPNHLLYAHVAVLPNSVCADAYRARNVTIDARVLCAGDAKAGTDACNGDSGGPLVNDMVLPDDNGLTMRVYYQLGIVSYGFRCTARRHTGVYTNVTHFMPWIEEKVLGKTTFWAKKN